MSFNFTVKEFILGNGTGTPTFQFYRRGFNLGGSGSTPEWKDIILKGNTALTLVNAKADGLNYLTLFGGTELLPETYLDTVTLSGGCEQRNLPAEYTQVNYVTNTAQTMINTGVKFNFSKKYEIELKARGVTGSWYILQAREYPGSPISGVSGSSTGNVIGLNFNGTYVAASQISRVVGHIYYVKGTINNGNMTLYVKDETAGTEETVTGTYTPITGQSVDIGLFGNIAGNYVDINSDLYFVSIKENDNYIMDYVPCRQSATAGFYDKVSGTFKTASNLVADGNTVPSPNTPMDIVSNNGAIKVRNKSGLPLDYTLLDYIESSGTQRIDPQVTGNARWVITAQTNEIKGSSQSLISSTPGASGGTWYGEFTNTRHWDVVSGGTDIPSTTKTTADLTFDSNGVRGTIGSTSVDRVATVTQGTWGIFGTTDGQYPFAGKLFDAKVYQNGALVRNFIPAKNSSNVIGLYDLVSGTFFTNDGTGTFTAGNPVDDLEIYTDGTVEQVTDSVGNTAIAQMLLSVGDYKDTQEVLSGSVIKNIGIKVMTGEETFQSGTNGWISENAITDQYDSRITLYTPLCTHFIGTSETPTSDNQVRVYLTSTGTPRVYFGCNKTIYDTADTFKQFFKDQYNAGTPVIIVYPTSSATTESVSGQFLSKSPVTQTAGAISNLGIAVTSSSHITPTPQQPLQINCNNGVLKVRHQSGLPLGYTLLEHIQSTGIQAINTGVKYSGNNYIVEWEAKDNGGSGSTLFACITTQPYSGGFFGNSNSSRNFYIGTSSGFDIGYSSNDSNYHKWKLVVNGQNATLYKDGTQTGTGSFNGTVDTSHNIYLFCGGLTSDSNPSLTQFSNWSLKSWKLTDNGVVKFNGISVKDSNNVLGIYDTVSGQFLTNQGTGTFTAGSPVSDTVEIYADGTTETVWVHSKNLFDEQWNRNTGTSTAAATWGQVVTASGWSTSALIPVKTGQQYTISYNTVVQIYVFYYEADGTMQQSYDTTSATKKTFTVPSGATHIRLQVSKSTEAQIAELEAQLELGSTATTYEPYYNGGSATAEMLLAISSYQDVQSVLDGEVTRNVGVKVLDGTEEYTYTEPNTYGIANITSTITGKVDGNTNLFMCSHFVPQTTSWSLTQTEGILNGNNNNQVFFRVLGTRIPTLSAWTQFLAAQYNSGNPVVIVYPLATPTTETVTGQPLTIQAGSNVVEITQASMDNLELEVSYKGTL